MLTLLRLRSATNASFKRTLTLKHFVSLAQIPSCPNCSHTRSSYASFTGAEIFKDYKTRKYQYRDQILDPSAPPPAEGPLLKTNLITVPVKLDKRLQKKLEFEQSKKGERRRRVEISRRGAYSKPIIVCKHTKLNHYYGQSYPKTFKGSTDEHIPLVSRGWAHRKATGDWFQIKKFAENYALQFEDKYIHEEQDEKEEKLHRNFEQLGIIPELIEILNTAGVSEPTVIQAKSIPTVLRGTNAVIASETGCGKTLCYLLPILQRIHLVSKSRSWTLENNTPLAIILVPSRELADQVYGQCQSLAKPLGLHTHLVQGGNLRSKINNPPSKIMHVMVSTPNALHELTKMQVYQLHKVQWVVLDEADSLLDDSFADDVIKVIDRFADDKPGPQNSQFLLVSATMPMGIEQILQESFPVADFETITTPGLHRIMGHVPQDFFRLKKAEKPEKILELVKKDMESETNVMIFCNKFQTCEWLNHYLRENGFSAIALNGSLPPSIRRERISQYLTGEVKVIVCTDIASRGIDTIETGHVINYDFPRFISDYIHRCGRTGRVGSRVQNGHVTSLIGWASEAVVVQKIEKSIRTDTDLRGVDANIKKQLDRKYGYGMFKPILAESETQTKTKSRDKETPYRKASQSISKSLGVSSY